MHGPAPLAAPLNCAATLGSTPSKIGAAGKSVQPVVHSGVRASAASPWLGFTAKAPANPPGSMLVALLPPWLPAPPASCRTAEPPPFEPAEQPSEPARHSEPTR